MDKFNEAVGISLRLLHVVDRFPLEIRAALFAKGFSGEIIDRALEHLVGKGVLLEERALESKLRKLDGKRAKGDQAISAELERLGANPETVLAALAVQGDELSRARALIGSKFKNGAPLAKVARFLNARGFSEETITSLLEDLGEEGLG